MDESRWRFYGAKTQVQCSHSIHTELKPHRLHSKSLSLFFFYISSLHTVNLCVFCLSIKTLYTRVVQLKYEVNTLKVCTQGWNLSYWKTVASCFALYLQTHRSFLWRVVSEVFLTVCAYSFSTFWRSRSWRCVRVLIFSRASSNISRLSWG